MMIPDIFIFYGGQIEARPRTELPEQGFREMYFPGYQQTEGPLSKFRLAFDPATTHNVRVWVEA